jgi:hypothetical protein
VGIIAVEEVVIVYDPSPVGLVEQVARSVVVSVDVAFV